MKPCATCKYRGNSIMVALFMSAEYQRCYSPKAKWDPVTGKPEVISCGVQRGYDMKELCGIEGRWHSDNEEDTK